MPPHNISELSIIVWERETTFDILRIITSNTAVPTDAALLPKTVNMEKKKAENNISPPSKILLSFTMPVNNAIKKIKMLQYNIPLRLCITGPGASLMLTQSAPKEMVIPKSILPK